MKRKNIEELNIIFSDTEKPLLKRKEAFDEFMNQMLNPLNEEDFNPDTFDPMSDLPEAELTNRTRTKPPKKLPTFNLLPKEIREGQMIGMYESKQDIYLILADRCNDLQNELDDLKNKYDDLKNDTKLIEK